jgi:alkyldihydroxyacetonephosphate synthase
MNDRRRRLGGWGFEGESFPPSPQLAAWLERHVGPPGHPLPPAAAAPPDLRPAALGSLAAETSIDPLDRLAHARGQGLADIIRLRGGLVPALPDAVCRPVDADEVEAVLATCAHRGFTVIPWGGGTSVTGGVNVVPSDAPVVTVDLERLAGLVELDPRSGLAVFGPGTPGPGVEGALAPHRLTLGHFPQSFELATVGGWVATRSSGQESLGYGRIEDLVAGLRLVATGGRLDLPAQPASAAGPDLRQLVLGSEGRLGVVTEVTLRVRPLPPRFEVQAALLPDIDAGLEVVRRLTTEDHRLTMVRLSDPPETEVAMAVGLARSPGAGVVRAYLGLRGVGDQACLLLAGAAGSATEIDRALAGVRSTVRALKGVSLGRRPGRHWCRDRFRHPYLRDSLLERGYATDTLETAVPWSAAADLRSSVGAAIAGALGNRDERVAVLCHASHPYRDGVSLYFTFFFRSSIDPEATIGRWATVKRAACDALVAAGATISHHHGVGQWHAPWLAPEIGDLGRRLLESTARVMDPAGILNPRVLLNATDLLER